MDITEMLVGKSDQLDNTDLLTGARDFTITGVSKNTPDQPLNITLAEFPRPWRPGLTMRRLLAAMWGPDASQYVGRRVRLYRDPEVSFGTDKTGGTRISHASHLDKPVAVSLPKSKGKFALYKVEPMPADTPTFPNEPTQAQVAECTDDADLRAWWPVSSPERQAQIKARAAELNGGAS